MARNKYPEQTVERILDVSAKLFFEKGYDNTSLQDIINELGGLTKGAIYHHFKSKEDIFDAVASKAGEVNRQIFKQVMDNGSLNGAEKLREVVMLGISSVATKKLIDVAPNLLDNPKFLAIQLREIQDTVTPQFIAPIVKMGAEDGSIRTDKPYALAEAITLLVNVWLNPIILGTDYSKIPDKCYIINEFLLVYGFVLFDEQTIAKLSEIIKK